MQNSSFFLSLAVIFLQAMVARMLRYQGELLSKCEEKVDISEENTDKYIGLIPVLLNNITYRNVYCALCNSDPLDRGGNNGGGGGGRVINVNHSFWSVGFNCVGNNLISTGNIQHILQTVAQCQWTIFPGERATKTHLRPCGEVVTGNLGVETVNSCGVANSIKGSEDNGKSKGTKTAAFSFSSWNKSPQLRSSHRNQQQRKDHKNGDGSKGDEEQNREEENRINNEQNLTPSVHETLSYACNYYQYQYSTSTSTNALFASSVPSKVPSAHDEDDDVPPVPPVLLTPDLTVPALTGEDTDSAAPFSYSPQKSQEAFTFSTDAANQLPRKAPQSQLSPPQSSPFNQQIPGLHHNSFPRTSSSGELELSKPEADAIQEDWANFVASSGNDERVFHNRNNNHYYPYGTTKEHSWDAKSYHSAPLVSVHGQKDKKGEGVPQSEDIPSEQGRVTFKNHHCALCNGVLPEQLSCSSRGDQLEHGEQSKHSPVSPPFNYYSELSINSFHQPFNQQPYKQNLETQNHISSLKPEFLADDYLYRYDLVFTLKPNGFPAELIFPQSSRKLPIGRICSRNAYFSIFSSTCKYYQCPYGFISVQDYCLPVFKNFSCSNHMFYVQKKYYRFFRNSTVKVSNSRGNSILLPVETIALDEERLVVCANYSVFTMMHEVPKIEIPPFLNAVFVVFGFCTAAFLGTALTLVIITKKKNSLTLISMNILITLLIENVTMFPRIFAQDGGYVCVISAIIDHYCWVVLFAWVCAFSYEEMQCQKFNMFQLNNRPQTWLYMVICWLSPVVLVMINTVMHFLEFNWLLEIYGGQSCSVSNVAIFLFSSVLPTAILITLAVFFLIIALYKHKPPAPSWSVETAEFHRRWLYAALIFLFLTGMSWCLHLLYNIVQIQYAYYACSFSLHIQSSVFGITIGYFMRLERVQELEHQRRFREVLSKQITVSYHKNSTQPNLHYPLPVTLGVGGPGTGGIPSKSIPLVYATELVRTPVVDPRNAKNFQDLGRMTLRSPINSLPNFSSTTLNRYATNPAHIQRLYGDSGTRLLRPELPMQPFFSMTPTQNNADRTTRESLTEITSEHNGVSDSEEPLQGTSTLDNLHVDTSSSNSSDSASSYKVISKLNTLTKNKTTNGPSGEERGKKLKKRSEDKLPSEGPRKSKKRSQSPVTSEENKVPTLLSENIGLVVDLSNEPSCSQISEA